VFGGIGFQELLVILLIVLLLFGAKRLPEFARALGKGIREFKKAASEIQSENESETEAVPPKEDEEKPKPGELQG